MMKICLIAVMIVLALIAVDITLRIGWDRFISGIGSLVDGQRHAEQLPKQSADIKNTSTDRAETPKQPAQPLPGALPWPGEQAEQQAPRRAGDWWRILTDPRHPDAWSCQNWSGGPGDAMRRADQENRLYRMDDVEEDGQVVRTTMVGLSFRTRTFEAPPLGGYPTWYRGKARCEQALQGQAGRAETPQEQRRRERYR